MDYLQEHLDQIYLQENLKTGVDNFVKQFKSFKGKSINQIKPLLKSIPDLTPEQVRDKASKQNKGFQKHYVHAQKKLKDSASTEAGDGLATLYATIQSIDVKDEIVKASLKTIQQIFDLAFKNPHKIFVAGAQIWLVAFLGLLFFTGIGPFTLALTGLLSAGSYIIQVGWILCMIKYLVDIVM